jgi:hypothetical protein
MENKSVNENSSFTLQTTVGELVAYISEIAEQAGKTEEEGYKMASTILERILKE